MLPLVHGLQKNLHLAFSEKRIGGGGHLNDLRAYGGYLACLIVSLDHILLTDGTIKMAVNGSIGETGR